MGAKVRVISLWLTFIQGYWLAEILLDVDMLLLIWSFMSLICMAHSVALFFGIGDLLLEGVHFLNFFAVESHAVSILLRVCLVLLKDLIRMGVQL